MIVWINHPSGNSEYIEIECSLLLKIEEKGIFLPIKIAVAKIAVSKDTRRLLVRFLDLVLGMFIAILAGRNRVVLLRVNYDESPPERSSRHRDLAANTFLMFTLPARSTTWILEILHVAHICIVLIHDCNTFPWHLSETFYRHGDQLCDRISRCILNFLVTSIFYRFLSPLIMIIIIQRRLG